jgi:hypothetical protein
MRRLRLIPTVKNYSLSPAGSLFSSTSGPKAYFGRAKESNPITVAIQFTLNVSAYDYIMAFYRTATKNGASPFQIYLIAETGEKVLYTAYFIPGSFGLDSTVGGCQFVVVAQCEIVTSYINSVSETVEFNAYQATHQ